MKVFVITFYTHSFFIKAATNHHFQILLQFVDQQLTQYTYHYDKRRKKLVATLKNRYCHIDHYTNSLGLQINCYDKLIEFLRLNNINTSQIEFIYDNDQYVAKPNNLILREGFSLKDYQDPIIDFILENHSARVIALQTGKGKTICSLYSIYKHNMRSCVITANAYLSSWVNDSYKIFTNTENEVIIINGQKSLTKLISLAKEDKLNVSLIIITQRCMSDYIKDYRMSMSKKSSYGCNPIDFYKLLGIGIRVIDECHRDLYFHFLHDIFTNVNKTIYNSATLSSNDTFINNMYEIIYPTDKRYHGLEWDKYIDMFVISYYLTYPDKAKILNKLGMYNHHVYEMWILEDTHRYLTYFKIIDRVLKIGYLNIKQDGQKALIFFQSVEMCNTYSNYLKEKLNESELIVNAFTSEDDEEKLFNSDIVTSTIGSSGTGRDIPGLILALNTIALDTKQGNIQCLGRLRKLDNLTPRYYQLVCWSITKHITYHRRRMINLDNKIKEVKLISSEIYI